MKVRKGLAFLVIIVYVFCAGLLLLQSVEDSLSVLRNGYGTRRYEAVGVGENGELALASRENERLRLTFGTLQGERTAQWSVRLPPNVAALAHLYPAGEHTAFLATR